MVVILGTVYAVIFVIAASWEVFWGISRPKNFDISDFKKYERIKIGRIRFYPYEAVGVPIVLFGLPVLYYLYPGHWNSLTFILATWCILLILAWLHQKGKIRKAIADFKNRGKMTEKAKKENSGLALAKEYLKAKKEKVCPFIEFTE